MISIQKNQCLIRRGEKEKSSRTRVVVQGTNTSEDWDLLMTLFCFICVVHMICSILLEMSINCISDKSHLHFLFQKCKTYNLQNLHVDNLLRGEKHHCDFRCFPRRDVRIDLEVFQHIYKHPVGRSEA